MAWWMWAILFSMSLAGYFSVNQQFKIRPEALVVWSGLGTAIIFAPTLIGQTPPKDGYFYLFAILSGLSATFSDNREFALTSKYGAGVIARMSPLSIALLCILWWTINPSSFMKIYDNKIIFLGICFCLSLSIVAAMLMKKDEISNSAIKEYAVVIVFCAFYSLFVKNTMSYVNTASGSVYFLVIELLISGSINAIVGCKNLSIKEFNKILFAKQSMKAGLLIIFFISSLCLTRNKAMNLTINPAYVDAIGRGATFIWIFAFNKLKGVKDKTNVKAGLLFVISAIGIILLSSL